MCSGDVLENVILSRHFTFKTNLLKKKILLVGCESTWLLLDPRAFKFLGQTSRFCTSIQNCSFCEKWGK